MPSEAPAGQTNTTDHDARIVRTQGQPAIQGYNVQAAVDENQIVVASEVAPDCGLRKRTTRPGWSGGLYDFMRGVLQSDHGSALYRKRQATVEPVFGQIKFNRGITRFRRRGKSACRAEWRLITATHNLLKLHNHRVAAAAA